MKKILNAIGLTIFVIVVIAGSFYYCLTHPMLSRKQIKVLQQLEKLP